MKEICDLDSDKPKKEFVPTEVRKTADYNDKQVDKEVERLAKSSIEISNTYLTHLK